LKSWAANQSLEPPGWIADTSFAPPDLSQSPQIACTEWSALRPADGAGARLVAGCFETSLSTWSDEIAPMALDKIASMALSTALRVRSDATLVPRDASRVANDGSRAVRAESLPADSVRIQTLAGIGARAKTSFGFVRDQRDEAANAATPSAARACFILCVADDRDECAHAIDAAEPNAPYVVPPPTTLWLRATLSAVHHPRAAGLCVLGVACAVGFAALVTRRRPGSARGTRAQQHHRR
jgi:hypothetical protein